MKKLLGLILCGIFLETLSCSKPAEPPSTSLPPTPVALSPGATPSSGPIPIDLGTTPTPEPLEYVLEDLKGTVLIRESGETQAEPAEEEETVEQGDEVITKAGSEASLTLDENTMFHLSENSDVKVDQLNPNLSNGFISRLLLLGGKVLSEVEKLGDSHSTFEVESGGVVCGVRGTAFEVFNQDGAVHTLTYHGTVEMRKGNLVQAVVAGHHSAFLLQKGAFQPPRLLKPAEEQRYQTWLRKKTVVQQKQARRLAAFRSLSPTQRSRMSEQLKGVKPKDRMRNMHQMLKSQTLRPVREPRQERLRQRRGQPLRTNQIRPRGRQRPAPKGRIKGGALKPRPLQRNPKQGQGRQKPANRRLNQPQQKPHRANLQRPSFQKKGNPKGEKKKRDKEQ